MGAKEIVGMVGKTAAVAFIPGGAGLFSVATLISDALAESQGNIRNAEGQSIDLLEKEARKQKIIMDFQAHQARVAQEVSIAQRIASSAEVEIEEYYDTSGKGSAGLKAEEKEDEKSITLGLSGEGRKITKRIIKFKGENLGNINFESQN